MLSMEQTNKQSDDSTPSSNKNIGDSPGLLKAILDSSLDMIQVFRAVRDDQGKIIDFTWILNNYASERIYGNIIGKRLLGDHPHIVREGVFDAFVQVTESGISRRYEQQYTYEQIKGWFLQTIEKLEDGVVVTTIDISKQKKAELEVLQLRTEWKERMRRVLETDAVGILLFNYKGVLIECNDGFLKMTGYSREEVKNGELTWQKMTPPEWIETSKVQMNQLTVTGRIGPYEKEYFKKDGRRSWLLLTGSDMGDGTFVKLGFDITDRKKSEAALRESEARLAEELKETRQLQRISSRLIDADNIQTLYDQILDAAIAIMHSDMGSMQMLFPEKNELLLLAWKGFNPESARFWKWVRIASASTCGVALAKGERVIVSNVENCEFMAGTEDLDSYRLSGIQAVQSTPLISRSGKVVGMISSHWKDVHQPLERELSRLDIVARQAADLIERKQTDDALRQQEANYRIQLEQEVQERTAELKESNELLAAEQYFLEQVTDKTPLLIYVFDLQEQRFTYINKRVEELIGRDQDYVYTMGAHLFQAIVHPEDLLSREQYMQKLSSLYNIEIRSNEFRIWTGCAFRWFRSRDSVFLQEDGRVRQVIGIAEDVTYEKLLQERLFLDNGPVGLS